MFNLMNSLELQRKAEKVYKGSKRIYLYIHNEEKFWTTLSCIFLQSQCRGVGVRITRREFFGAAKI